MPSFDEKEFYRAFESIADTFKTLKDRTRDAERAMGSRRSASRELSNAKSASSVSSAKRKLAQADEALERAFRDSQPALEKARLGFRELSRRQEKLLRAEERRRDDIRKLQDAVEMKNSVRAGEAIGHLSTIPFSGEFDVFVSHASEDKEGFVDPLVSALHSREVKVWYDSDQIRWGDSIRSRIDEGLAKARYGLVVISRHSLDKAWPRREVDALFSLEIADGKNRRILPIWHDIEKDDVLSQSPLLADKVAVSSAVMSIDEIADQLATFIASTKMAESGVNQ